MRAFSMKQRERVSRAFTVFEIVIALAIAALVIACLMQGFVQSAQRAEMSAYVLAAQARAVEGLEQVRAARWDPSSTNVDEVVQTNFPPTVNVLDLPKAGTYQIYATNYTTIRTISTNPALRMVRVDTVWPWTGRTITNSIVTYRAPDQ
jgi:type II secretory pathway pseudopilin PulG